MVRRRLVVEINTDAGDDVFVTRHEGGVVDLLLSRTTQCSPGVTGKQTFGVRLSVEEAGILAVRLALPTGPPS